MDHVINIKAVNDKLPQKPRGNRLYHFFIGVPEQLTPKEIKELKHVLTKEHEKVIKFIENAKPLVKKTA